MGEPAVIPPRGGEVVGDTPSRRVEVLAEHDALHATRSWFGPGREGADLHVHRHHTDLFYVLEGELTLRLGPGGESVVLPAGTLARMPPLVVHGFRNASDAEVSYLNLHAPGRGFAAFLRGRAVAYDQEAPPADGGRPATEAVIGGAGRALGRAGGRTALLADVEEIAVAETWLAPGGPPAAQHVHRRHAESVFVLEGELALGSGGRTVRAAEGSWLQIPSGVPHALAPAGPGPARVLELHAPASGFGTPGFDERPAP